MRLSEMIRLEKPIRFIDETLLARLRLTPCLVCGSQPSDPAHVKSRGAGGGDEDFNLMPLCRKCHCAQHALGIVTFARRHWGVYDWLLTRGWVIEDGKLQRAVE